MLNNAVAGLARARPAQSRGFTLIEIMIVVAIAGILAAVAFPAYQSSVEKGRRSDAQAALTAFGVAMERYYTDNRNSYLGAARNGADTGVPDIFATEAPLEGSTKFYDLTIGAATRNSYTLVATPKGAQAGDGNLRLFSNGVREWQRDGTNWVNWDD
ncbi:type IV pilin protein [Marinobacter sp. CA1]|uniref:type IV pilin protein n=1 Tax=Marinobacter sp. CA1 TaxID=2817656 RepID=UPI002B4ABD56|nr:type IV pilin protein [Marinobacter sp. CA1]UDL04370.1 type IV pilin protein [Marinobacter sp. CA1]